jgi:enoyl-CoA hydratase/carnithine racemase
MSSNEYTFSFENDEMFFYVIENMAILKLKNQFLTKISDIEKSSKIFSVIEWVEKDPIVNSLLIFNEEYAFSQIEYCQFMDSVTQFDKESVRYIVLPEKKLQLVRQIHAIRIFIKKIICNEKNFIFCLNGHVSTLAFALSLTGDYRFANSSFSISLPNKKYDFPPVGGLPFLLSKYLGQQKANNIILEGRSIDAMNSKELNLINEIIENDSFEQKCIDKAKTLAVGGDNYRKISKHLINYYSQQMDDYFNYETKISGF